MMLLLTQKNVTDVVQSEAVFVSSRNTVPVLFSLKLQV